MYNDKSRRTKIKMTPGQYSKLPTIGRKKMRCVWMCKLRYLGIY